MSLFSIESVLSSTSGLLNYSYLQIILKTSIFAIVIYISTLYTSCSNNELLARYTKFKTLVQLVNKYPGLKRYPLVGSLPQMIHLVSRPCQDLFPCMQKLTQNCGPIFKSWIFYQPKLIITCPETAIASLTDDTFPGRTSELVAIGKASGGEALIVISPDVHSSRKKIWKQWFTRRVINGNLATFQKEAIRISEALSMKTSETFNLVEYSLHCTFRIIASSAFGEEYVNSISESSIKEHFHGLTKFSINLFTRVFRPWLANDFIYYHFTSEGRETKRCVKSAHKLTYEAIAHAKILRKNKFNQIYITGNTPSFLDHLLDVSEQGDLIENEIFQELNNFIVAGYDTTGLSISWTMYLLALHPECQTKIVKELNEIFNGNVKNFSSQVTPNHLQNMRYLELCIKESLRLYPALAMLFRRSAKDKVVVMPDGNIIPSGVDMHVPLRIIHKDPKYFPEPEKFMPERHLGPVSAFMPFGLGIRNCIGQVYAMQEMKVILAYLIMEYKWETLEKPCLEPLMVPMSYPKDGLHFRISKRSPN